MQGDVVLPSGDSVDKAGATALDLNATACLVLNVLNVLSARPNNETAHLIAGSARVDLDCHPLLRPFAESACSFFRVMVVLLIRAPEATLINETS